ncbi:MAG: histidinol-phosphate transaminase [Lachnospiraceae bacterium]|nr:histidinol-phosphate transaminase [Lachnospiraceae bacterium]
MYYVNPNLPELERIFDQNERKGYLRLDLNENPGGLPEEFIAKVLKNVDKEFVSEYPETRHFQELLAKFHNAEPENICLVNGSAEGIRYIIEAFTSVGGRVVGVVPSYFMFQVYSEMYGREFIRVNYEDDLNMDVHSILNALTEDTQLLVLLNPNNPMGNVYTDEELELIMEECRKKEITVLIDEAYHYFHPKTFIHYALEERHVLVTRTFSKVFAMAGCRLGYVVGAKEDIKLVQKLCTPHNTNAFALKFAEEILTTPGMIDELVRKFREGRSYLLEELDKNGYLHKGEAGNFLFIQPKTDAAELVKRMKAEKKILIKSYPNVGELGDCLRTSIGEKQYMERFMEALLELDR